MGRPSRQIFALAVGLLVFLLFFVNTEILRTKFKDSKPIPLNIKNRLCTENILNKTDDKTIYFVTPTYPRPTQMPELTRLSHTLMHVPNLHWIVADDERRCSEQVLNVLRSSRLSYTHLSSPKPYLYKTNEFPRGVANRLAALAWIRQHTREGILYFGDDDNTYDLKLFEEIRKTKRVGMLPVGLVGTYGVSSPVVSDGKVVAFFDPWPAERTFPVDMSGFAVNIEHIPPTASMPYMLGYEEDRFLLSLGIKMEHIEPLAENCSKVYVWHTQTVKYKKADLRLDMEKLQGKLHSKYSSFVKLLKKIVDLGMATISPGEGAKIAKNRKVYDVIDGLR